MCHSILLHSIILVSCSLCFFNFKFVSASQPSLLSDSQFDFIVVGGGTGGCVAAGRLSENGKYKVLLLEAGGVPTGALDVPALALQNLGDHLRAYSSVPQQNAGLEKNGIVAFMTGWTLGGGSAVNAMNFNRGSPHDFDNWANLTNDQSWSYSNLLHYFKKVENYVGNFPTDQHGYNGPIGVSKPRYSPSLERWYQAGRELGYPIAGPNGPQRISFAPIEFSQRNGRRVSSYKGFIQPYLNTRKNLRVLTHAIVSQIVFDGNRAVGVKYSVNSNGTNKQAYARATKEVILSAGVIESPVLLMKSGIGPKSVLKKAKIPQIKELPVGKGFQDQAFVILNMIVSNNNSEISDPEHDLTLEAWRKFNRNGEGPFNCFEGLSGQAFLRSSVRTSDGIATWADLHVFPLNTQSKETIGVVSRCETETDAQAEWETSIQVLVVLGRPQSRGTISLNPQDIDGPPVVDFNMLSDTQDIEVLLDGIKMLLQIYEETEAYRNIGARYPPNPLPACKNHTFRSDEYWKCYIKQKSQVGIHAGGSCRMGSGFQDPDAVVDSKLRVIGVEGLRVVDASIAPVVANANNQAVVYVIAEKASDMILTRHSQ